MKRIYLLLSLFITFTAACSDDDNNGVDPGSPILPVEAKSAFDFVNSIGVNTHFGFYETNYWDKWEEITFPRLKELGVKHIRDGYGYRVPLGEERFIEAGKAGIKLLLSVTTDTPEELTPKLDALLPYLSGVEAINEVDLSIDPDNNPEVWVPYGRQKQEELYTFIKNTPKYSHLPVVGLSLANLKDNAGLIGDLSGWVDYGNIHAYASARHPANHWGYGLTWDEISQRAQVVFGNKPLMATEAGYHNYEQQGLSHMGVPEDVSAIYLPHLFFEYFNKGIVRTYIYEFLDQHVRSEWADAPELEWHFGLVRTDGEAKPAFYALKNLIALIDDTDEGFKPSSLAFALDAESTIVKNDLRYTLLQKSNGKWWIAIYRTTEIYNPDFLMPKPIQKATISLTLQNKAKTINMYVPNTSQEIRQTWQNQHAVTMELGGELVLLEVEM
ncbi:MAG: hypothetical protein LUG18_06035 [Candidatus Azobacteroides sp.]|nr:hypothetical protein [Candidatus Azobacteroides sp.]